MEAPLYIYHRIPLPLQLRKVDFKHSRSIPAEYTAGHTMLGMTPGLWMRAALTAWKTSTKPSVLRRSN